MVLFEVEVRRVKQYVPPHCDYDSLETERKDYVPLCGCEQRRLDDIRISIRDPQ